MSRLTRLMSIGVLVAIAVCVPGTLAAQGKIPSHVRVVTTSERVLRWLGPQRDVILVVDQGTILEVLDFDRDEESYWVILPPDLHGTRKVGWIKASGVEPHVAAPATAESSASDVAAVASAIEAQRDGAQAPALATPSTGAPATEAEKVTLSVRRDTPAASPAAGAGAGKSYAFDDVHFELERFSIRSEDLDTLRAAAAALKDDPSLVMTIEGHTCSLGSGAYNLALGTRRADAVKDYLVSEGVPASRLITVSQGESHAEHDNSKEETRRLNRRVALVPKIQR